MRQSKPRSPRASRRVKTPTVLQMEWVECGAAALGIVLGYYGRIVPLEELRVACGVSRDGSRAKNLVRAARDYGLEARGAKVQVDALRKIPLPAILHWNFHHFVVLEGFRRDKVYLNDPRGGPRVATAEELNRSFTGVALIFRPGSDFQAGGRPPSLLAGLWRRLVGLRTHLLLAVLVTLLLVIPGLLVPYFTRIFVDSVLIQKDMRSLEIVAGGMAFVGMAAVGLTWAQRKLLLNLENCISIRESRAFMWHLLRLPMAFYLQRSAGDIASRVAINDRFARLLSGDLARTALSVLLVVTYAGVMFRYDVLLTLIGVLIAGLNFLVLRQVSRTRRDSFRKLLQAQGRLSGSAMAGLRRIDSLKAGGAANEFFALWAGEYTEMANTDQELGAVTEVLGTAPLLLAGLSTAVVLAAGGLQVMNGQLSVGELVAFQILLASFLAPIAQLVMTGSQLQELEAGMNRLDDALRHPVDVELNRQVSEHRTPVQGSLVGTVELRDITFGYSRTDACVIDHFSLTLDAGRRVAIVGETGSGKSTVARVLAGLYQPWEGEVLFDGRNRSEIARDVLAASVALVDQDIVLFHGTVRENLTLWDDSIPDEQIVRAAKDACIHEEIMVRPGGYDRQVEENGRNLSGGEAQRLEIARALARNPRILILDEATSALDPIIEEAVMANVTARGCTCLIIAHRLSTIRDCDEIIVLERGRAVQRGTHKSLMEADGRYALLIRSGAIDSGSSTLRRESELVP